MRLSILQLILMISLIFSSCNAQLLDLNNIPLREGVVIDMTRSEVILSNSESNLESIVIHSGKTNWKSTDKLKPLILDKGIIYCQNLGIKPGNELNLKGLDNKATGKQVFNSSTLFDKNIKIEPRRHNSANFSIEARNIDNELVLAWNYKSTIVKGIYEENEKNDFSDYGFLKINSSINSTNQTDKNKYKPSQFYVPVTVNKKITTAIKNSNQYQSRDGKHILVSSKVTDDLEFFSYKWEIFEASTQKKIGELNDYRGYAPFVVKDGFLIYDQTPYERIVNGKVQLEPLKLIVFDLKNKKILWSKEIFNFELEELMAP